MMWKLRKENAFRSGGLQSHITEKQSKLGTEKYPLIWLQGRKVLVTLKTVFLWSGGSRNHALEV